MSEAATIPEIPKANSLPLTLLVASERCELGKTALRIVLRLYNESKGQNELRGSLDGIEFYKAFNEVKRRGYLKLVKASVLYCHGRNKFSKTPNIWTLSDIGRKWVEDYCREIEEKVERMRHGY